MGRRCSEPIRFAWLLLATTLSSCGRTGVDNLPLEDERGGTGGRPDLRDPPSDRTGGATSVGGTGGSGPVVGGAPSGSGGMQAGAAGSLAGGAGEPCAIDTNGLDEAPWSLQFGDGAEQSGSAIVVGKDRSAYLSGAFEGEIDVGGGAMRSTTPANSFVARLDGRGKHVWSRALGDYVSVGAQALAVSEAGTLWCGGRFLATAEFGSGQTITAESEGAFLASFNSCGRNVVTKGFGSGTYGHAGIESLAGTSDGGVVAAGWFMSELNLGSEEWSDRSTNPSAFIARFDALGATVWAQHLGTAARDLSLTVDAIDNVHLAGSLTGSVALGGDILVPDAPGSRAFVAKLDPIGRLVWSHVDRAPKDDGQSSAGSVSVDGSGNTFVLGGLIDTSVEIGPLNLAWTCCGPTAFVMMIDPSGEPRWVKALGNQILVRLANGSNGMAVSSSAGAQGFDVWSFDPNGTEPVRQRFGGFSYVNVFGAAARDRSSLFVTGHFRGALDLGQGPFERTEGFDWDGFAARIPLDRSGEP
jgi:hypothetical protein